VAGIPQASECGFQKALKDGAGQQESKLHREQGLACFDLNECVLIKTQVNVEVEERENESKVIWYQYTKWRKSSVLRVYGLSNKFRNIRF
jgi:hypothetical protein